MTILIKATQLILSLSILVILHELGHFVFAKAFKCRVEKFYLFFNPWFSLFKYKKGETEYGLGWLPLGGYVKISGMIDESMDIEQMKKPAQPWEFRSKPAIQRLLIMLGGVIFNLLFAILIYSMSLSVWGEQYLPNSNVKYGIVVGEVGRNMGLQNGDKIISVGEKEIEDFHKIAPAILLNSVNSIRVERNGRIIDIPVKHEHIASLLKSKNEISPRYPYNFVISKFTEESAAKAAGLKTGDEIISVNNNHFKFQDEFYKFMQSLKGEEVNVLIKRKGEEVSYNLTLSDDGKMGVYPSYIDLSDYFETKKLKYRFLNAFPAGARKGVDTINSYLKQFKLLFTPKTKAYESLGGFISFGSIFPPVWDWQSFWNLTALISVILAIMNMLPIPALDGGHALFVMFEIVSGRKPGDKFMEYAQIAGIILIFSLLLLANGNDIVKLFK